MFRTTCTFRNYPLAPSTVQYSEHPLCVKSNLGSILSILKKDKGIIIPVVKVFFSDVQNEACSIVIKDSSFQFCEEVKNGSSWSSPLFFLKLCQFLLYVCALMIFKNFCYHVAKKPGNQR
jgi:hypothetical protein